MRRLQETLVPQVGQEFQQAVIEAGRVEQSDRFIVQTKLEPGEKCLNGGPDGFMLRPTEDKSQ